MHSELNPIWSRSTSQKGIPHGKPFRVEGSFERKTVGPKYCKMQPKLTFWSIWVVLGLKWFKMVPKLAMQPSSFRRFWAFQASSNNPFRRYGVFQASFNNPFRGFLGLPSLFKQPLPRVPKRYQNLPFVPLTDTLVKQPLRELRPLFDPSEGLVEGRFETGPPVRVPSTNPSE